MSSTSSRKRSCQTRGTSKASASGVGSPASSNDDEAVEKRTATESKKTNLAVGADAHGSQHLNPLLRDAIHLKVLVPSSSAGAIIGKGGETIGELQKQAGARIKMSKSNDYYPGTNERVCLISGTIEGILHILDFIGEKIREKPDPTGRPAIDFDNKISAEREKQIKLLIPNSTAGMIIGKAGAFIRQIKDESGAFIQLSQKSKDTTLSERVVTVIGDPDSNRAAMEMILEKIEEDPQSGNCLNISYSDVHGLVANSNPTGSPFAAHSTASNSSHLSDHSADTSAGRSVSLDSNPFVLPLATGGALNLKFNMDPSRHPTDPALMGQYLGHIGSCLRNCGYSDMASEEIGQALRCLATHGIVVINLTSPNAAAPSTGSSRSHFGHASSQQHLHQQSMGQPPPPPPFIRGQVAYQQEQPSSFIFSSNPNSYSRYWSSSAAPGDNLHETPFGTRQTNRPLSPRGPPSNQNSFGLGPITSTPLSQQPPGGAAADQDQDKKTDIEVNENIIGAVIGPSGRSIVDIQQHSGSKIKISRKGTFSPGTRNRIVTITGSSEAIATAKLMIEQKIAEEENKRERNTSH